MILRIVFAFFCCGSALLAMEAESQSNSIQLVDILRSWTKRATFVQTVRCDWTEIQSQLTDLRIPENKFVTHSIAYSFQIGPDCIWHKRVGPHKNLTLGKFLQTVALRYHDSEKTISLSITPEKNQLIPEAAPSLAFVKQSKYDQKMNYHVEPLILHYRATNEQLSPIKMDSLKLTSDRKSLNGHNCLRLEDKTLSYWVDIEDNFLIRRYIRNYKTTGTTRFQVDIDYRLDSKNGSVPVRWSVEKYTKEGRLYRRLHSTITFIDVNGEFLNKDELSKIPEGTFVEDHVLEDTYILLANNRRRTITKDDRFATYKEQLESKSGEALPKAFVAMREKTKRIRDAEASDRVKILAELNQFLTGRTVRRRHTQLLANTANELFRSADPESAIRMCHEFSQTDALASLLSPMASRFQGELLRTRLVGSKMVLTGKTIEGHQFDWSSYRGKIVLVEFWFTGCKPCIEELPRIKRLYEQYRTLGFEVVGVNIDAEQQLARTLLANKEIPWLTIYERPGTKNSNVSRYNVSSFPFGILVGRDGKVISLNTRGKELEKWLNQLLGSK